MNDKQEDVYGTFNVLVRRKPEANNFRAVLGKKKQTNINKHKNT